MVSHNYFLDANVILRYLLKDNEVLSPKSKEIFDTLSDLTDGAYISSLVLHEVIYVMEKIYKLDRSNIENKVSSILELTNLETLDLPKINVQQALKDYASTKVDFPDCIYKQFVLVHNFQMVSFDEDFKKIKLKRLGKIN